MNNEGYSTILDAILFLAMVSVCVIILSPVLFGQSQERYATDSGVRSLTANSMETLQSSRVDDVFKYSIMGDWIQKIEDFGHVDNSTHHILNMTEEALLGRKNEHKSPIELAAENAACQFILNTTYKNSTIHMKLDPFTGEYDTSTAALIDASVRAKLDARYDYEFNLRWAPFANVPIEGNVTVGGQHPKDAESTSMLVTMPYTTQIDRSKIDAMNNKDLGYIATNLTDYKAGPRGPVENQSLHDNISTSIMSCLNRTVRVDADEIWDNTLGSKTYAKEAWNPLNILKKFIKNETLYNEVLNITSVIGNDVLAESAKLCNAGEVEVMTDLIVDEAKDGTINTAATNTMVVDWLKSRYDPAKATATLYVWVK